MRLTASTCSGLTSRLGTMAEDRHATKRCSSTDSSTGSITTGMLTSAEIIQHRRAVSRQIVRFAAKAGGRAASRLGAWAPDRHGSCGHSSTGRPALAAVNSVARPDGINDHHIGGHGGGNQSVEHRRWAPSERFRAPRPPQRRRPTGRSEGDFAVPISAPRRECNPALAMSSASSKRLQSGRDLGIEQRPTPLLLCGIMRPARHRSATI